MIAVSIVTYKVPDDELRLALSTLVQCKEICRIDIIDNARSRATENVAKEFPDSLVNYIPSDNIGYGAANNISIRNSLRDASAVKYHLVMNSDIRFSPEVITRLKNIMDGDPTIALTIPKVTDAAGHEQSSYHPLPSPIDLIARRFLPRRFFRKRMARYDIKVEGRLDPLNVPYVHGCFMLMRCSALEEVGLFDERFFMYPEDIDLTRRLNEKYKTLVIPTLSIVHHHRAESRRSPRLLFIHITNMIKYFNKWGWIGSTKRLKCRKMAHAKK